MADEPSNKASLHMRLNLRGLFDPRPIPPSRCPERTPEEIVDWIVRWMAQERAADREPTRTACYEALAVDALQDPPQEPRKPFCAHEAAIPFVQDLIPSQRTKGRPPRKAKGQPKGP